MAKIDIKNLLIALSLNNEWLKQYVYDTITNFSPTSVNVARILSHMSNTTIHVSRQDKDLWDSTYERAKEYMDDKFKQMSTIELKTVSSLPSQNISSSIIYLLETGTENVYEQYVYSDGKWVSLGSTSIDMSDYYTKDQIDEMVRVINSTSKHTHSNKDILDLITAPFTINYKTILDKLNGMDIPSLEGHTTNADIHLSTDEQTALNELIATGISNIVNHLSNSSVHLSQEEKQRYDNILNSVTELVNAQLRNVLHIKSVNSLPPANEAVNNTLYIVPAESPTGDTQDVFDEWLFIGGEYEKWGSRGSASGDNSNVGIGDFVTQNDMKRYVQQNMHSHSNMEILRETSAVFTETLLETIRENSNKLGDHTTNDSLHLSTEQTKMLSTIGNLESTVKKIVTEMITNNPDDSGETSSSQKYSQIIRVSCLPDTYGDVNKQAIYLIKKKGTLSTVEELVDASNIADVTISTNYDAYVWSDDIGGWEHLAALPLEYVESLPVDTANIKPGVIYCVPSGQEVFDGGHVNGDLTVTSLPVNCRYNKYIWDDTNSSWEILYESTILSDNDISYILS